MSMSVTPLQDAFWLACEQMLLDHTYPMDLDNALVSWGYSIGPCEAQDLMGLDVVLTARSGVDSGACFGAHGGRGAPR